MLKRNRLFIVFLFVTMQVTPQKAIVRDSIYIGSEKIKLERGKDYRIIKSPTDNKYAFQRLDSAYWNTLHLFSDNEYVYPKILEIEVNCGSLYQIQEHKPVQSVGIYPQGKNFPLALYAVTESELSKIGQFGWNTSHIYRLNNGLGGTSIEYINASKQNGLLTHTTLPYYWANRSEGDLTPVDSTAFVSFVRQRQATNNISWWDIPEELRYWRNVEFQMLKDYSRWTRIIDPEKKPNYMYIPGHYGKDNIGNYVQYLDIIPASCYVEYMQKPRSYVRNQIEKIFRAMNDKNLVEGRNYLNNEKTVIAILELYRNSRDSPLTAEGLHHDFWSALASGAKGIFVYSHAYRMYHPEAWEQLCLDAANLTGDERLDQVILYGEVDSNVFFKVTKGDQYAPIIEETTYPALNIRAFNARSEDGNCYKYIIAVNSSPEPITAEINGVLSLFNTAKVLFEERDNIQIVDKKFTDTFKGYGVHIYKVF